MADPAAPNPAEQSAGVGTTGAQTTSTCADPGLKGLPRRPKPAGAKIPVKIVGVTQGSLYYVRAGKYEVLLDQVDQTGTVKNSFELPSQGTKSRKVAIELIVSSPQCENSPWKVVKKIRYEAPVQPPAATPPAGQPGTQPATPVKPAQPATPPKPATPAKPVTPPSSLPKLPPKGPLLSIRTWMTPLDGGSRADKAPVAPKLSRVDRKADKAKSSAALVGLAGLFVVLALGALGGLALLKRRDDFDLAEAFGVLPQHLEEGSPDMLQPEEEPATAQLAANATEAPAPAPAAEPAPAVEPATEPTEPAPVAEPVPGAQPEPAPVTAANGNGSPSHHPSQVEAELQRLLTEAGIEAELGGILADAKAEAERRGVSLDSDLIVRALCDELNGAAALSEPKRAGLRSMFAEIIAEETGRVPEKTS